MAKIKTEDIKQLSMPELIERINEEKIQYRKLVFNHIISPIENPLVLRETRKNIARLKTERRFRELGVNREEGKSGSLTTTKTKAKAVKEDSKKKVAKEGPKKEKEIKEDTSK